MNYKIKENDITDIAIRITDMLVEKGLVMDCTDTDSEEEFDMQDEIKEVLNDYFTKKLN